MQDDDRVPDCVLRLPTRRVFLLRGENGWRLSDKASDVFDLEANEYHEVELPVVKGQEHWGSCRPDSLLVKPALDLLEASSPLPGTVTVRRNGVSDSTYDFADKMGDEIAATSRSWLAHVSVGVINSSTDVIAQDLRNPSWPSYPSPEAAPAIAAAAMKNGGRLGCLHCYHPTDSSYGPLADALAAHGVCIQDGDFLYDPDLADKRRKGRASRRRSIALAPVKEEERRAEAKRADEEDLKTIKREHLSCFCQSLTSSLIDAALYGLLDPEGKIESTICAHYPLAIGWDRVQEAYDLWDHLGRHPYIFEQLPDCIGSHNADPGKVIESVLDRMTLRAAKVRARARAAGMKPKLPRGLNYARSVAAIYRELKAEADSREPPVQNEGST